MSNKCPKCNSCLLDDLEQLDPIHTLYLCLNCEETVILIHEQCSGCGYALSSVSLLEIKTVMGTMEEGMSGMHPSMCRFMNELFPKPPNFIDYLLKQNCTDCPIKHVYNDYRETLSENDQENDKGCLCDLMTESKKSEDKDLLDYTKKQEESS